MTYDRTTDNRTSGRRLRGDEGAVLVEFALFAPLLAILVLGMLEAGIMYRDYNTLKLATRSAARAGSNTFVGGGDSLYADYNILFSIKAALGSVEAGDINRVVIYKANTSGTPPAACATGAIGGSGVLNVSGSSCNAYSGTFLSATLPATSAGWNLSWDNGWQPTSRDVEPNPNTDLLGVAVYVNHATITGLFGPTMALQDLTVVALEPNID